MVNAKRKQITVQKQRWEKWFSCNGATQIVNIQKRGEALASYSITTYVVGQYSVWVLNRTVELKNMLMTYREKREHAYEYNKDRVVPEKLARQENCFSKNMMIINF